MVSVAKYRTSPTNNIKNKLPWRRLDNSAKIFPMSTGEKYSTVFRLSVVLKEEVKIVLDIIK